MTDKSDTFTPLDRPQRLTYTGPKHYDWVQANLDAMGLTVEQAAETFAQADRVIRIEGDALSVLRQVALSVTRDGLSVHGGAHLTVRCTDETVALGDTEELRAFHRRPGQSRYARVQPASTRVESFEAAQERWAESKNASPFDALRRAVQQVKACLRTTEGMPLRQHNAIMLALADMMTAIDDAYMAMQDTPELPDGYIYGTACNNEG